MDRRQLDGSEPGRPVRQLSGRPPARAAADGEEDEELGPLGGQLAQRGVAAVARPAACRTGWAGADSRASSSSGTGSASPRASGVRSTRTAAAATSAAITSHHQSVPSKSRSAGTTPEPAAPKAVASDAEHDEHAVAGQGRPRHPVVADRAEAVAVHLLAAAEGAGHQHRVGEEQGGDDRRPPRPAAIPRSPAGRRRGPARRRAATGPPAGRAGSAGTFMAMNAARVASASPTLAVPLTISTTLQVSGARTRARAVTARSSQPAPGHERPVRPKSPPRPPRWCRHRDVRRARRLDGGDEVVDACGPGSARARRWR